MSDQKAELTEHFSQVEERLLRDINAMRDSAKDPRFDQRWLSIAQTELQKGFMALSRAISPPEPVALPEDTQTP